MPELFAGPLIILGCHHGIIADDTPLCTEIALDPAQEG